MWSSLLVESVNLRLNLQCYWSELDGNGTIDWADAELTEGGVAQALLAHKTWQTALESQKIPAPQTYYVSPLDRCLSTARLTFAGLALPEKQPFVPVVKEVYIDSVLSHLDLLT